MEESGGDPARTAEVLGEMRSAEEHLEVVAENLLQVGRMTAGLTRVDPHPLDLAETVAAAVGVVRLTAADRGQTVEVDCEPGLVAYADGRRLRQALVNLLGNAVKFSPPGGRVRVAAEILDDRTARVAVEDDGPGVPVDQAEAVFQPYYRVEATSGVDGSGLGLAISRDLVRRMGGEIALEPAESGGARFVVTLPRRAPAGA